MTGQLAVCNSNFPSLFEAGDRGWKRGRGRREERERKRGGKKEREGEGELEFVVVWLLEHL